MHISWDILYIAAMSCCYRLGKVIPHATLWQYISWLYFMIDMFLCIAENIVRKQLTCLQITSLMSWSNDSSQCVGLHVSMEWRSQQWDTIHFWYQYSLSNEYIYQLFLVVTQIANAHINVSLTSIQHLNVRSISIWCSLLSGNIHRLWGQGNPGCRLNI